MNRILINISVLCTILLQISCATKLKDSTNTQISSANIASESFDTTVKQLMLKHKIAGTSIGIIKSGKLDTILCYGVLQKEKEATVNSNSMFSVGSISKVGNAFVILKLVEEGILDLDTDVNTYLKDWKVINSKYNVDNPVTLRTILSHTAGFSVHGFGNYYPNEELPNTIQILEGKSPAKNDKVELIFPVGTEHKYSGGGITVSQKIIEDVTEMEYEQAALKFLFEPLGLRRTTYENPLPQSFGNIAKAHNENGSPDALPIGYQSMPEKAAAGLWTTPKDLYKLMEVLMNDNNEFISKSLKEDMISREENSGFGLGPYIDYVEGEKVVVHNGLKDSYAANFTVFWNTKTGYLILTNGGTNGFEMIKELRTILKLKLGLIKNKE